MLDSFQHSNQSRYASQRIFVVQLRTVAYVVPFVSAVYELAKSQSTAVTAPDLPDRVAIFRFDHHDQSGVECS